MTDPAPERVDWSRWTVVLLKPDCLERDLVDAVLERVSTEIALIVVERVTVADWQIFVHYWDLLAYRHRLDVDVAACLRDRYVGHDVVVALGYSATPGVDTATRVRALLGDFDPSTAEPGTIRADLGNDSLAAARREHRLVDNLIHTSDDVTAAARDFHTWFGGHRAADLLRPPATADRPEVPTP
ncbi:nucleoside-diphosphate kinase [Amycolatopsis sp. DG1A-15b]|uniref:nucleoside-diphosphate kinase n=1 Tax=Amycolatopsis sp. DG1A-15b TaxID=3052846 RepID=UPI00255B4516|nr:nucleoside-diphosphate kinase [Amycolatopsis sp. DG1A-15b]WIX85735.1 nucleoside-diphosphate kinase [Amycolatopsis sp. DG1A-15b]